jgi:hypothetical protein
VSSKSWRNSEEFRQLFVQVREATYGVPAWLDSTL